MVFMTVCVIILEPYVYVFLACELVGTEGEFLFWETFVADAVE